jgi:hypothetical protein
MTSNKIAHKYGELTEESLHGLLLTLPITALVMEVLLTDQPVADVAKADQGKQKNHWAFRLTTSRPFTYLMNGTRRVCMLSQSPARAHGNLAVQQICYSVRVSIEHPPSSLRCPNITMKTMANGGATSYSAVVDFTFPVQQNLTLAHFLDAAQPLLPFEYKIVAMTLRQTGDRSGRQSGRDEELDRHPNGCRDFT